jgi:hypothetical protein
VGFVESGECAGIGEVGGSGHFSCRRPRLGRWRRGGSGLGLAAGR